MSINLRNHHIVISLIALMSLAFAYFVEYVMNLAPCYLCIYQRFPYFVLIIISVIGLFCRQTLFKYYVIVFLSSILLAGYHTGIERGIFEPTPFCTPQISTSDNISPEEFKQLLYNQEIGMCNKPALVILGLSMTEWNLLLNILLLTILIRFKNTIV